MRNKDDAYCTIGFRDVKLRLIGIPLAAFFMPIAFFGANPIADTRHFLIEFLITFVFVLIYWHVDRGIVIGFRKKYPYFQEYKKRVVLQTIVILVVTSVLQYLTYLLLQNDFIGSFLDKIKAPSQAACLSANIFVSITVLAIYESMYAFDMWSIGVAQYERLKKENIKAQLDTLKNQVKPHFLFNSLNTLAALIPEKPDLAVEFVEKLSKVYRFVLEIKDKQFITLKKELQALDAYVFLLKMRFGENIRFSTNIDTSDEQLLLLPLSIQMLVENAVKHNVISSSKPLSIDISVKEGFVVVKNNLQIKKQLETSTKTGLMNIQKRYSLLSKKQAVFISDEHFFIVKLPLVSIHNKE